MGAETADAEFAQNADLDGIVLDMGKDASSCQLPHVSGSLVGALTPLSASLRDSNRQPIETEAGNRRIPSYLSAYKTSYYSPDITISDVNACWTWSLEFKANEDISLVQTQVAFFSCDKTLSDKSCKDTDCTISYKLEIVDGGNSLTSSQGTAILFGAEEAEESDEAGYDFAAGKITSGSGAVVAVNWPKTVLLKQGSTYTYSMTVSCANNTMTESTGVGFGGIRFIEQSLPEPSSAALLLLGVIFFVSRRRRASRA